MEVNCEFCSLPRLWPRTNITANMMPDFQDMHMHTSACLVGQQDVWAAVVQLARQLTAAAADSAAAYSWTRLDIATCCCSHRTFFARPVNIDDSS